MTPRTKRYDVSSMLAQDMLNQYQRFVSSFLVTAEITMFGLQPEQLESAPESGLTPDEAKESMEARLASLVRDLRCFEEASELMVEHIKTLLAKPEFASYARMTDKQLKNKSKSMLDLIAGMAIERFEQEYPDKPIDQEIFLNYVREAERTMYLREIDMLASMKHEA